MSDTEMVRQEDREEYRKFCWHHLQAYGRPLPSEIWHYTTAEGLIGIIQSRKIWATQISCLNDTLEQRYFGDLVHAELKQQFANNADESLDILFRIADFMLENRDFSSAGHFVACFTEIEDDLGQWRGYGGGECGYAIGLNPHKLMEALTERQSGLLLPMNYSETVHKVVVTDVIRMAKTYFRQGLNRFPDKAETWATQFLIEFSKQLDIFACLIKHPTFERELERRITVLLRPEDLPDLMFRPKKTLLARHLPLDLSINDGNSRRLPITRIYVGPGQSQRISKVSVGDLLLQHGYERVAVELSRVPYRIP